MSRTIIIQDIIPIITNLMNKQGANLSSEVQIRDENLIEFLHNELTTCFSICGSATRCEKLKAAIKEAREHDEIGFIEYIKLLLNKYVQLQLKLRNAQKLEQKLTTEQIVKLLTDGKPDKSPPDKLTEFRKKNPYGPDRWIRKKEQ